GQSQLCDLGAFLLGGRQFTDQTARHHTKDGKDLGTMVALGTFSPYTVVSVDSCVKIDPEIPLEKAALVGCGVTTGWGSAVYAADVQPGETVVIYGVGGIGNAAVQGAALAGAGRVIVVEPVEWKREKIMEFGATHTAATHEEAFFLVQGLTNGAMADKAILCVGTAEGAHVAQLMQMIKKAGRAVVTSVAPMLGEDVKMNLFEFAMQRKELVGCIFGNANPQVDIPMLLALYKSGKLKLDEMITTEYTLDDINQGYQDMRDGKNFRGIIRY
ncbi:MAG: zinc-binding dehydrogenase, partial [Mycobacteriales bacterium]